MRILKFEAPWCGPCKAIGGEMAKLNLDAEVIAVDIEDEPGVARLHQVRSVPTLVLLNEHMEEIGRLSGKKSASQIQRWFDDTV